MVLNASGSGWLRHGVFIVIAACCGALAACDRKPQALPAPPPAPVGVLIMRPQHVVLTTELPGRTDAFLIAEVRPQVSGVVTKRIFVEGSDVRAGEQLYQIDPATYEASLESAEATLARGRAALATARAKASRFRPLAAAHVVSRQDFDDATATAAEANADIAAARASVDQARINLGYTKVMAPITGRISRSAITQGALVTSGQATALAIVTQLDPIYVDLTQSATMLVRLRRELAEGKLQSAGPDAAQVTLKLEDGSDYGTPGKLQFSEVNVDQGTGTVVVRAIFPNPDHMLLPGMYVHAQLMEGADSQALLVPQGAVSRNTHGDPTVLLVGEGNKAELRIIEASRTVGTNWLVTGGLKPGEKVIVEGFQKVRPGAPVDPQIDQQAATP